MIVGMCYALLLVATAIQSAILPQVKNSGFGGHFGFYLFITLQACAVLMLSPLVGVGNKQGYLYGAVVGLGTGLVTGLATAAGLTSEVAQPFLRSFDAANDLLVWVLPLTHSVCGAIGGLLGGWIWRPLPDLYLPRDMIPAIGVDSRLAVAVTVRPKRRLPWAGPICWTRVGAGVLVAFMGVVCAGEIIQCAVDAGDGYFKVVNESQNQVTLGEVFALAMLLGGCISGAGTPNGIKQGLCVGLAAGAAVFGLMVAGVLVASSAIPAPVFWAIIIGPLGGWFGTELLPPVARRPRHRTRR
jgi:hypothetical protein